MRFSTNPAQTLFLFFSHFAILSLLSIHIRRNIRNVLGNKQTSTSSIKLYGVEHQVPIYWQKAGQGSLKQTHCTGDAFCVEIANPHTIVMNSLHDFNPCWTRRYIIIDGFCFCLLLVRRSLFTSMYNNFLWTK